MGQNKRPIEKKSLFLLWGMLALACILIFHSYILGNETLVFSDVGSDTREQYITWYNSLVNHLRNGSFSFWDFHNGLGSSMFQLSLFHPMMIPVYGIGTLLGPEHIAGSMVYLQIFQILLAGTAGYFFLSEFFLMENSKIAASFMYVLNGYLMVWGQHYQLGYTAIFLPLLLLFVERSLKRRRAVFGAALISAILVLASFYLGYMCLLGGGIYVVFRVFFYEDAAWKKKIKDFFAIGFSMALGMLMGAVNLLPAAAFQLGTTRRMDSDLSLLQKVIQNMKPYAPEYYKTLAYRFFGSNLQHDAVHYSGFTNYYEAANVFFSTLFLILALQYLFTIHRQRVKTSRKAAQYISIAAVVFLITVQTGSLIFNGFAYAFSRHTFLLMPLFALVSAKMLEQIFEEKKLSLAGLALAAAAIAVVYGKAYRYMDLTFEKNNVLFLCLTGLTMAGTLLWAVKGKHADKKACSQILLLLLFVNMVSDTMLCYQNRDTLKKNDVGYFDATYHSSVNEALDWIAGQEDSFYRVEKDFHTASGCMDAMIQDYDGVSTYNSVQNENIARFVKTMWPQLLTGYDENHYKFSNSVREHDMASLVGVKYLLSRWDKEIDGYELCRQVGDVFIYRNTGTDSIGKFFTHTMTEEEFEKLENPDIWNLLKEVLVTETAGAYQKEEPEICRGENADLLDLTKLDTGSLSLETDGTQNPSITAFNQHFVYLPLKQQEMEQYDTMWVQFQVETDIGTELEVRMSDERSHVCYQYAGKHVYKFAIPADTGEITLQITNGGVTAKITDLEFFGTKGRSSFSKEADIRLDVPEKDSELTGSIHAERDGMVMLAIPFENGWSVFLNGEEQELVKGDYGFLAFEVKSGDYVLNVRYEAPMLKAGAIISLVSCLLFVVLWVISGKLRYKERR